MKSYRKILSAVIAGALLSGLTGCGQGAAAETTASADTSADKNVSSENTELKR